MKVNRFWRETQYLHKISGHFRDKTPKIPYSITGNNFRTFTELPYFQHVWTPCQSKLLPSLAHFSQNFQKNDKINTRLHLIHCMHIFPSHNFFCMICKIRFNVDVRFEFKPKLITLCIYRYKWIRNICYCKRNSKPKKKKVLHSINCLITSETHNIHFNRSLWCSIIIYC